jgi:hypothetical protein
MTNPTLMYSIYEDLVQSASEANVGRELTEKELKRLAWVFVDDEDFSRVVYSALVSAVEEAIKEEGWEEYDKTYENIPLEKIGGQA